MYGQNLLYLLRLGLAHLLVNWGNFIDVIVEAIDEDLYVFIDFYPGG